MTMLFLRRGSRSLKLILPLLLLMMFGIVVALKRRSSDEIPAYAENRILRSAVQEGVSYRLADDGNVFRVIDERGTWTWVDRIFDPEQIAREFVRDGDTLYAVDQESGRRFALSKQFEEGFEELSEGVDGLRALIGEDRRWTEFTLQTPETPTVPDYVALRTRILRGNASFMDASVAPSALQARSGRQSLRCVCPAKSSRMVCSKASLGTGLIGFEQNDDFWFCAWFRVDGAVRPLTLADVEGRHVKESPGMRLMLFDGLYLGAELKALDKPKYRQSSSDRIVFPADQWVKVTWHLHLHPDQGRIQIWQDDTMIVDESGPTLPFAGMFYNSLEVGIPAHALSDKTAVLFVDDVVVAKDPLR